MTQLDTRWHTGFLTTELIATDEMPGCHAPFHRSRLSLSLAAYSNFVFFRANQPLWVVSFFSFFYAFLFLLKYIFMTTLKQNKGRQKNKCWTSYKKRADNRKKGERRRKHEPLMLLLLPALSSFVGRSGRQGKCVLLKIYLFSLDFCLVPRFISFFFFFFCFQVVVFFFVSSFTIIVLPCCFIWILNDSFDKRFDWENKLASTDFFFE